MNTTSIFSTNDCNTNIDDYNSIKTVVKRIYSWIEFFNLEYKGTHKEKEKLGLFATIIFNKEILKCVNTGIYSIFSKNDKSNIYFKGFEWTKESLQIELEKKLKEMKIEQKLADIEKDFKD